MFRRKPGPDLIRAGYRFADKNMRHSTNTRACSDSNGTEHALAAFERTDLARSAQADRDVYPRQGMDQSGAPARKAVLLPRHAISLHDLPRSIARLQAGVPVLLDPLSAIRVHLFAVRHGDLQH